MPIYIEDTYRPIPPLDHPRILWDDIARRRTAVTASSAAVGFEAVNALDYFTYDFWKPTSLPATLEIDLAGDEAINYVLIAAHTLGTDGASVKAQRYDAGSTSWVDITATVAPADDGVIAFLFENRTAAKFRISVSGVALPSIGVVMMGQALVVPRKIYQGHSPITLARRTVIRPQSSEGGEWLGRSVRREGVATEIAFTRLKAAWIRETFQPFMLSARTYPFGWLWRPEDYPDEVAYVWIPGGDIKPVNSGPRDLMSVSFSVEGHAG